MKRRRALPGLFAALLAMGALMAQGAGSRGLLRGMEVVATPGLEEAAAPVVSPDGRYVALTKTGFQGLYLLDPETGRVTALDEAAGAGFRPVWSEDSRSLAFRLTLGLERRRSLIVVAHPDGVKEPATPLLDSLSLPFWLGGRIFAARLDGAPRLLSAGPASAASSACRIPVATPEGRLLLLGEDGGVPKELSTPGKVFFLPILSEDGQRFVVQCLDGHLYLGSAEGGELKVLGPGSWPSFVRGDSALLFQRTVDDGHALTSGDIFLMDLASCEVEAVTATVDKIELHPSMASDGHTLYFDAGGRIWRGWVP